MTVVFLQLESRRQDVRKKIFSPGSHRGAAGIMA
jgi:hypothetical protein